jgi:NADPH:quinone reductase-like Zn-dependent oxidoreductase
MRKVVIHSAGGYDKLKLEEHPNPTPAGDQVLVETEAIGVNDADCCVRWGVYEPAKKYVGFPITPGFEFAGTVVAAGDKATHKVGARVLGVSRFNAYSTHVIAPSHQIFPLPKSLTAQQAAAFPSVYMTAHYAVLGLVRIRPGGTVLIHSAAGGVGTALLEVCRVVGLRSIGVVGASHKVEVARRAGADHVIDKSTEDLWRRADQLCPEGFDAIFDANGHITLKAGYDRLAPTGKLIVYGSHALLPKEGGRIDYLKAAWGLIKTPRFNPMDMITANKAVLGFNVAFLFDRADLFDPAMADLFRWLDEGKIKGPSVTTFPFEKVADAHRAIESGKTTGKLVLLSR